MLVIRARVQKMLDTMANREYHDQTASFGMGAHCLFIPFWQASFLQIIEHLLKYCKTLKSNAQIVTKVVIFLFC